MGQICAWNSNNSYTASYQKTTVFHKDYTTLRWLVSWIWSFFLSKLSVSYWYSTSLSPLKAISQAWRKDRWWSFIFSGAFPSHADFNHPLSFQDEAHIWPTEIKHMYHCLLLAELLMVILNIKWCSKQDYEIQFPTMSHGADLWPLPRKFINCESVSRLRIHNQR